MEFWINQTFNGLSYAALLFLLGGGFTLIFGVMKIANIAHGSFYLVGGYIGYTVVSLTGNFYLALLVAWERPIRSSPRCGHTCRSSPGARCRCRK